MTKKKFFIMTALIIVGVILSIILIGYIYLKTTFKRDYENIIIENIQSIKINNESLNKNFVLSLIKQESKFETKAKSNKDAFGLMQLTFPTAKEVAQKLNLDISIEDLYKPEINIKLGINYLNYLFTIFDDKQLVLLSYNAGFNKVKNWLENNEITKDNGIYQTPYKETNIYIKKVLTYEKIYNLI